MIPGVPLLAQNTAVNPPAIQSASHSQLQQLLLLRSPNSFLDAAQSMCKEPHASMSNHTQTSPQCIQNLWRQMINHNICGMLQKCVSG